MSCNNSDSNLLANKIEISGSADSCCIFIRNIDKSVVKTLIADGLTLVQWQSNISVYKKTDDEDVQDLEKPIPGNYILRNNQLIFKPTKPFKKGERYLVALYLQNPNGGLLSKLKTSNSPFNQKPIQKVIKF
nr:hypothetical protein [uncultured Pedobacter sp.]